MTRRRRTGSAMALAGSYDPSTLQIRQGRIELSRDLDASKAFGGAAGEVGRRLVIWLPKKLDTPNAWLRSHWRDKVRLKAAWAELLRVTVLTTVRRVPTAALRSPALALGWTAPTSRCRVTVDRQVASPREFIRDQDNHTFASKPLIDCLVQAGFLVGDRTEQLELVPTQQVSADGLPWTVVTIELAGEPRP